MGTLDHGTLVAKREKYQRDLEAARARMAQAQRVASESQVLAYRLQGALAALDDIEPATDIDDLMVGGTEIIAADAPQEGAK